METQTIIEKNCCMSFPVLDAKTGKKRVKRFCSGGAFISESYVMAYMSEDGRKITDWHGHVLTETIQKLGERATNCGTGFYLRFELNGKTYSGFCLGNGGIIHARRTKKTMINGL